MNKPLVVDKIAISTGGFDASQDPYGQGAAWVTAVATAKEAGIVSALRQAAKQRNEVTIKCPMLEVDGTVGQGTETSNGVQFVFAVQDIRFIKPKRS